MTTVSNSAQVFDETLTLLQTESALQVWLPERNDPEVVFRQRPLALVEAIQEVFDGLTNYNPFGGIGFCGGFARRREDFKLEIDFTMRRSNVKVFLSEDEAKSFLETLKSLPS